MAVKIDKNGNIHRGGRKLGTKLSDKTKKKISDSLLGHVHSAESIKKQSASLKKYNKDPEVKQRKKELGQKQMKKNWDNSDFTKKIIGKKRSAEQRKRMSTAQLKNYESNPMSEQTKQKLSKALIGNKRSVETLKKQSESMKKLWTSKAYRESRADGILTNTAPEREFKAILEKNKIRFIQSYFVSNIDYKYPADFYLPDYNLIVEIDGLYWHNYPNGNERDDIRTHQLKNAGYKVLRYWEKNINEEEFLNDLTMLDKIKVYISAGWFSKYQMFALKYLERTLDKDEKFKVFSPRRETKLEGFENPDVQQKIYDLNLINIRKADIVISSTVEKDCGAIFENGYAAKCKKPIIYTWFDDRFKSGKFNLMLAKSGIASFTDKKQFEKFIKLISSENYLNISKDYEGEFE